MNHFINLQMASAMATMYRANRELVLAAPYQNQNVLPICETFDRDAIDQLLDQTDCQALRIYYGMNEDFTVHAIVVGVDSNGADILPSGGSVTLSASETEEDLIAENGARCPDVCPPTSPLNTDNP